MPKGPQRVVRAHLEKARAAALAAVEAYNKPGSHYRTPHYIVMMTMAWTALFHAIFFKNGRRPVAPEEDGWQGGALRIC